MSTFLDYLSLIILLLGLTLTFYAFIYIHDLPYKIAKKRHHPQKEAIHVACWLSLFTLHALWPFLWIWAMLYRPERGWGFAHGSPSEAGTLSKMDDLTRRIEELESRSKLAKFPARAERVDA